MSKQSCSKSLILTKSHPPEYSNQDEASSSPDQHQPSCLRAAEADIAQVQINYSSATGSSLIATSALTIGLDAQPNVITVDNTDVNINTDLAVNGDIRALNANFGGRIDAAAISTAGDVVASTVYGTNSVKTGGLIEGTELHIIENATIDGVMLANIVDTDVITIRTSIQTPAILSNRIESPADLDLSAAVDCTINIPNFRPNIDASQATLITPASLKLNRIFIVSRSTIIEADPSCDGLEIILYNCSNLPISIRDNRNIIMSIKPRCATRLLFLNLIGTWVTVN